MTNMLYARPRVSCTTTIHEVPTKSISGPCSRDEVLAPSDARPGRQPRLPHSSSNKPPPRREVRFDKVVTGLLGLSGPINLTCGQYKSKLAIGAKMVQSLIDTGGATTLEPQNSHGPLPTLPFRVVHFPLVSPPGHNNNTRT
jgi:hypothetical protein